MSVVNIASASSQYRVIFSSKDIGPTPMKILPNVWIYWKENSTITTLRTDVDGYCKKLCTGGTASNHWEYTEFFTVTGGASVEIFYTNSSVPLHTNFLTSESTVFEAIKVPTAPSSSTPTTAQVNNGATTTITLPSAVSMVIINNTVTTTKPEELSIWPLLWEKSPDDYYTSGIHQGAALWTNLTNNKPSALTITEYDPAPAITANVDVRPHERGLNIEGKIDSRATGVFVKVIKPDGTVVKLHQDFNSTVAVDQITGILSPTVTDNTKSFKAGVFFDSAENAFGPVQVIIKSDGIPKTVMAACYVHLCGIKSALVNDTIANVNGQVRGTVQDESNELIIVDFLQSPQASKALLAAETRARRMIRHPIENRDRPYTTVNIALLAQKPEMPMWMVEGQVIGLNQSQLQDLMVRRKKGLVTSPTNFELNWQFKLNLAWDGPDSATTSPRRYHYQQDYTHSFTVTMELDANDTLKNVTNGEVTNAFNPVQNALTYPVANRRTPKVIINGQQRAWQRSAGSASFDTCVFEWQPHIENGGNEIIRGGIAKLTVEQVSINSIRIDPGKIRNEAGNAVVDPPVNEPDYSLPEIRVPGTNPTGTTDPVVNNFVQEYHTANSTVPRIQLLPLACWQDTVRLIFNHESRGCQFDNRGTAMRRYDGEWYGFEDSLPIFGPPHGYGMGQHDNPPVSNDGAWNYMENIRESVRRIMADKASGAYTLISTHLPNPLDQKIRAVYQREIVRRYNGNSEFSWIANTWKINPSSAKWADDSDHKKGANPRLGYPNAVLGTTVTYFTGTGAASVFPWPITFNATDYGPST